MGGVLSCLKLLLLILCLLLEQFGLLLHRDLMVQGGKLGCVHLGLKLLLVLLLLELELKLQVLDLELLAVA